MKYSVLFIIAAFTLKSFGIAAQNKYVKKASALVVNPAVQKEDLLGNAIFDALKKKDNIDWLSLYPTNNEFESILESMLAAKTPGLTQEKIDEMLSQRKKEATEMYKAEFNHFTALSDSLGIDWKDAVFLKFNYDTAYTERIKLVYLNGDTWFSCKGHRFVIEGIEALELSAGYRLQAVKNIRRID